MTTNLNNISVSINATKSQVYQVPTGKTAIALSITVAPLTACKLFITKTRTDNKEITLIQGQAIASGDTYVTPLQKTVLLSQEKLNCLAQTSFKVRATGFFGLPTIIDPLQPTIPEVAHISISLAER